MSIRYACKYTFTGGKVERPTVMCSPLTLCLNNEMENAREEIQVGALDTKHRRAMRSGKRCDAKLQLERLSMCQNQCVDI